MDTNPLSLYQDEWILKCFSIAGYTFLVYDHTLTFDMEVEFVWRAPWTFTKAVFLLNRYGNLICQTIIQFSKLVGVANHSAETCDLPNVFIVLYMVCSVESIHILVLLRAWAIWGCQIRVAVMLIGSYFVYLLPYLIKAIFTTMTITILTFKYANLPEICVTVIPPYSWILCLASACQNTVVFVITMVCLWRHSKNTQNLYPTSLLFLLVRDAFIFYIAGMFYDVLNVVTWTIQGPLSVLCTTFSINLLSIAGQRLVLNLRGFKVRTYGSRSLSAEVDRQLEMIGDTRLEWWNSSTRQSDISRVGNRRRTDRDIEMDVLGHDPTRQSSGPSRSREEIL